MIIFDLGCFYWPKKNLKITLNFGRSRRSLPRGGVRVRIDRGLPRGVRSADYGARFLKLSGYGIGAEFSKLPGYGERRRSEIFNPWMESGKYAATVASVEQFFTIFQKTNNENLQPN